MRQRVLQRAMSMAGALVAVSVAVAGDSPVLEQRLRASRPEIRRWQTEPIDAGNRQSPRETDIVAIGRVGVRTPVRYADGHVAWFTVAGFQPVLVSLHSLDARAPLGVHDVALAESDVLALGCAPLSALDAHGRWRAARRLNSGAPLCASDLERIPEVERDQPVTFTARRGAIEVSRVFTAATDARAGERVRLRDRTSGATILAIVTGPGLACDPAAEEIQ